MTQLRSLTTRWSRRRGSERERRGSARTLAGSPEVPLLGCWGLTDVESIHQEGTSASQGEAPP